SCAGRRGENGLFTGLFRLFRIFLTGPSRGPIFPFPRKGWFFPRVRFRREPSARKRGGSLENLLEASQRDAYTERSVPRRAFKFRAGSTARLSGWWKLRGRGSLKTE